MAATSSPEHGVEAVERDRRHLFRLAAAAGIRPRARVAAIRRVGRDQVQARLELESCRDLLADLEQPRHLVGRDTHALAQHLLVPLEHLVLLVQLLDELAVDRLEPAVGDAAFDDLVDLVEIERFRDVVVRALAQRVDRGRGRGVARDDDHRDLGIELAGAAHHVESRQSRQIDVGQNDVGAQLVEQADRLLAARAVGDLVALRGQELVEHVHDRGLVVDDEDPRQDAPVLASGRGPTRISGHTDVRRRPRAAVPISSPRRASDPRGRAAPPPRARPAARGDARRRGDAADPTERMLLERTPHARRAAQRRDRVRLGQQQAERVAAEPRDEIRLAQLELQHERRLGERGVAGLATVARVERSEVVEIDEHRARAASRAGASARAPR
jgi:hypothetical protein